ncbi:MAG: glycosyl hydrolase-related protein, partial [Christensenellaceae bacterium]
IKNPEFTYEIPMGSMKRMIQNAELPAYRYVALSDNTRTLAMFNDCKHGFNPCGNSIFMTVARGSYSPDARPDDGMVSAKYAISSYYGLMDKAQITRDAMAFNQPLIVFEKDADMGTDIFSNIICKNQHIVVTCIKPALNNDGTIVRLQECSGNNNECELIVHDFGKRACEVDLTENIIRQCVYNGVELKIKMAANEIKTILFL